MSAACTDCRHHKGPLCDECITDVPPGELPTRWVPVSMHAVAVELVEAARREEQPKEGA